MERKVPPPRGFGGPPVDNSAEPRPFARRIEPPTAFEPPPVAANTERNSPPPPPQQPHAPQSFGFPAARGTVNTNTGATRRGWRPGRVGGRHDSPLYGKHRKRPSSSSIDSNVSWSGSEIESVGGFGTAQREQEQASRLSWTSSVAAKEEAPPAVQQDLASAASLFRAPAVEQHQQRRPPPATIEQEMKQLAGSEGTIGVQPPKTPLGKPALDNDGEISAAQRVRMELTAHAGSRSGSRANSSENVFANTIPPVYDEEKNGPQSCPSTFINTRQPQFSIDKLRQLRSNELVASKLLPTRTSVNSLMGYVRELQLSEATLRKQLVKTKQHTEDELSQSLSKVNELERTMQEVERDRELARRKLEEQEQLIRDLAAKLKRAEAAKSKSSAAPAVDELPPIAEEGISQTETEEKPSIAEEREHDISIVSPPAPAPPAQPLLPPKQAVTPSDHSKDNSRASQFGLASPRSPNRPLWDPWASGSATPMKNLPPVFTIGSTGLDLVVASSTSSAQASTAVSTTTSLGEYELKSVLMSPRRVQGQVEASEKGNSAQHSEQSESAAPAQQEVVPQYFAPVFNVGATPSPPYPQQQDSPSPEMRSGAYSVRDQEEAPLMKSPSQNAPMLPAEMIPPSDGSSFEQPEPSSIPVEGNMTDADGGDWSRFQVEHEMRPHSASLTTPVDAGVVGSEGTDPLSASIAGRSTISQPAQAMPESVAPEAATRNSVIAEVAQAEQMSNVETEEVGAAVSSAPPMASNPPRPASLAQNESSVNAVEPVSLETLLVDFFTEVDKKRLKMAKAYGKRYAGREEWLFAELTKRYGAAKVAALKARYENGSGDDTSTASSSGDMGKKDDLATKPDGSSKTGRQGHPRHPQFFQPPTRASNMDLSAGISSVPAPAVLLQENDAPSSQRGQEAESAGAQPSPSEKVSPGRAARVSPSQRRSVGSIPPFADPPSSSTTPQEDGEGNNTAATVGSDDPPMTNGPATPIQPEEPTGQFNYPPSFPPRMENNNAAPLGLRRRPNASGPSTQRQTNAGYEPALVTLENLLKELYKKHQPDKLKNVPIVAKQYAGKERELVGLLKGKYGALSVKRLEENLEVLERASHSRAGGKGAGKKRGCFVRTVSLLFWLSVLLYFSFGTVFVSFVVLDAWECRALDNDDQELESGEDCLPLKEELETFTYERVAEYVGQSHPDVCFCLEWKARESAMLRNWSGKDLVNLARLVPFSPESFGAPWITSVKEQVPSQEFYDGYAKPVVDLSLDVGSFVWAFVLELAGYEEEFEEKSAVVKNVAGNDTAEIPSLGEEHESDAYVEKAAEDMEHEGFVYEEKADGQLIEETVVEAEAADVVLESEEVRVEEEAIKLEDVLSTGESNAAMEGDVSAKGVVPVEEESATVDDESFSYSSEAQDEEYATVDSTGMPESEAVLKTEDVPSLEGSAFVDTNAEELAVVVDEAEVKEALAEEDSVIVPVEETESVEGDASIIPVAEVADTMIDAVEEEASEDVKESEEVSVAENAVYSDVVEVEVRQEGLGLSYPETEMEEDVREEVQAAGSTEVSSAAPELESEAGVAADVDVPSESNEAETELIAKSYAVETLEESEPAVDSTKETLAMPSVADTDIEVAESESDVDVASEASDIEVDSGVKDLVSSEVAEMELSPDLSEELESVAVDAASGLSIPTDVDEVPVLTSEEEEGVAKLLGEEVDLEAGQELEALIEVEKEAEMASDQEERITSKEDQATVVGEEESVVAEPESDVSPSSNDVDAEESLIGDENTTSASTEEAEVIDGEDIDDEESAAAPVEVDSLSENADANVDWEDAEVVAVKDRDDVEVMAVKDEDKSTIPAEVEAVIREFEVEEDSISVFNEEAVPEELAKDFEDEAAELTKDTEKVAGVPADIDPVAVESVKAENTALNFPSEIETESLIGVVGDETEVSNDDLASTTRNELEPEQSASEVDLVTKLDDKSEVIEATHMSVNAYVVESAEGVSEQSGNGENFDVADTEEVKTPRADETTSAVVAPEEAPNAVDEAAAISEDEEAPVGDDVAPMIKTPITAGEANLELAPLVGDQIESVDGEEHAEEASNSDEPTTIDSDDKTELEQEAVNPSISASEAEESVGLVSAVNEVLARLVEPFEAAKTAAPVVAAAEGEHRVDEL